ncbi:aldehyde dehydrogenase family protein [Natronincola ferrireducens]|uniref:Succinate-semialdehyde dehydrogenase n=1 Tax=Natronincola ferrireducens TaxID=393762 RepID=A0A1G8YK15_9FIRM|nr:aldehyde dehydrogenase family protein [Natronincola ferrireducens]SDK03096.1 succinate-semialdehyde dehydrogenase [Natronincola ferrireducens]
METLAILEPKEYIGTLVEKARIAQGEFEKFTQEEVDEVVREMGKVIYDNAVELAKMAVEETRMGIFEDKVKKNQGKSKTIWNSLKGKKSVGIIDRNEETGIVKVAKPVGVVASVTPTTNPIVTPMCNAMFALKGRNAIIIAPHPRAKKCSSYTVELMNKAIAKYRVPENLIQIIEEPSIDLTNELMKAADVVVATGGMGMVQAAYSSGKPAYGVGAGNVQCIVDRDVDIQEVVPKIITGRTFDNGIICSGEQTVIAPEEAYDKIMEEFIKNGGYFVKTPQEKEAFRKALFVDGVISKDVVGQSPQQIAKLAGITIPQDTKVILIEADGIGEEDVLCKEKMCPVLATFKYKDFKDAVTIAQTNLEVEGKGHSCAIHSNNKENIEYAGEKLTISRLVVNQPSSTSAGGSLYNGFAPTTTLGCGTWGNNSISENLNYTHLINVSQIGYFISDRQVPTDEEIWK